jgi:hypothetical protein
MADPQRKDAAGSPQAWQPGLTLLAKSLSRDNLTPLARVSDRLSDVKRSGEQLMLTAQSHVAKLAEGRQRLANDLAGMRSWEQSRLASSLGGMRKSSSETNMQRACRSKQQRLSRLAAGWPVSRTLSLPCGPEEASPKVR